MFRFLKRRAFLVVLGFILLALFIWYAGPLFEFADYRPLEPESARLIAMALVVVAWIISALLKRLRANRASDKLVAAVVQQSQAEQPNPEAVRLREKFEEAVAALKQKRRSGHSLYDLPWYVIVGAPGSGKTTALVNSGLHFPLEQRSGKGALRGVGGTRNCDWWFTDEAIFLDTAGRYLTQDSDAHSDKLGWTEFLSLLRKYRKRRPVNGVILTASAQDLMVHGTREREAYVEAARRRLEELNNELGIQLPVYLMVTKCDLVAGFSEYFDDLAQDGRAQVWGVTFPYDQTRKGGAAQALPEEFDALIARLNERVFTRLDEERDGRRRTKIFGFPQQMAALREALVQFVSEVFESTRFDRQILLRGVYFTSGTQEGTPIDRLLGALGRRFAVAPDAVLAPTGRGKAYFIEHLLKRVLFAESGLAGVNRRLEVKKAAAQLGAYAAMIAAAVVGVIAFTVSYNRNRTYIGEVAVDAAELQQSSTVRAGAPIETLLPRLDAVRHVVDSANRYADGAPWLMRFGLFQGSSLGNAARDAYARELNGALLSETAARIERRLVSYAPEPEKLFEYLKAYLMLGDPDRLDEMQLGYIADLEWSAAYENDPDAAASASRHFHSLLEDKDKLRPVTLNQSLITEARNSIRQASIPGLMYRQLRLAYAGDEARALRLDQAAGLNAAQVLRRKSGISLAQPVPGLYTAPVFREITSRGTGEIVKLFADDQWVWGGSGLPSTTRATLAAEVTDLYEKDYIAVWDAIVKDIEPVPLATLENTKAAVAILAAPTSPLRGFLKTVDDNTFLVKPPEPKQPSTGITGRIGNIFETARAKIGLSTAEPGAQITVHFAQIHQLVAGEAGAAPIDGILSKLEQVQQKLNPIGPNVGGTKPSDPAAMNALGEVVSSLKQDTVSMPPVVGGVVARVADRALSVVRETGRVGMNGLYERDVVSECRQVTTGRYPFDATSGVDVPLDDFGRIFGYGGVFDTFFKSELEALVDTTRGSWAWRADASGAAVGGSMAILRRVEAAQRIRRMFFRPGASMPEVTFTVTPAGLDAAATRFLLEIDGRSVVNYRFDLERPVLVRWPGMDRKEAAATIEDKSGSRPIAVFKGEWAWFRLIDAGQLERQASEQFLLTFEKDGHKAQVEIGATSVNNPFGSPLLKDFRCE